jgi:DNA-binding HxlR family transcriptional regulator
MNGSRNGYGQYCPISRAVEVLGERWSLLILRDMLVGRTRFNDLARGLPGLSRTLLAKRLRELEHAGIVTRVEGEYHLTEAGNDLRDIVFSLGEWGARWTFGDPEPEELDAELLVWWMHTRIDTSVLPDQRTILHIRFSDDPRRFWIMIEQGTPAVCVTDPGFEVDVTISSDVSSLYRVWLGRITIADAAREHLVRFDGPRALTRQMPKALQLSPVAGIVSAARPSTTAN